MFPKLDKEESKAEIFQLVEQYLRNKGQYENVSYKEDQLRREYINRFFKCLGWDVYNEQGSAEQYKEVVSEDSVKIGRTTKAPDYSFRVGGTRKFFVEVKKPSLKIKENQEAAYQLRRYAWNAKLPLSILTNFEEFAVYDCRIKPNVSDSSSVSRIEYITLETNTEKINEIFEVFSREAVLQGSFDKFSERGGRGTSEVDDEFLREIEAWREKLAKNIALRNERLTVEELNFAVQTIINRMIFLRIEEDRSIERYGRLLEIVKSDDVYKNLVRLFQEANGKYDAGLFDLTRDRLTPKLEMDDKVLGEIIPRLYYPESPYDFSVIRSDILGQVYERFLGKVIRLTETHRAKVEEKEEVKKSGGIFYTPDYIAQYIINRTLGQLTENKTPEQISSLKVLDPACGSGTFLLEAYQYLLDYHLNYYLRTGSNKQSTSNKQEVVQIQTGWRLTTAERKRILLNNIFGVDIDSQAVEVTKLNLLLKCLEGENQQVLYKQLKLFNERVLPNIDKNIKCGNTLVSSKILRGQTKLTNLPDSGEINPFDYEIEFKEVMEKGGFDCIIGNPPYIRIQRIPHDVIDYLFENYSTPIKKSDISLIFIEKAHKLLAKKGLIGFICSSQWMSTDYGERLREYLAEGYLQEIVNFGSLPVFSTASTYPAIFIISKSPGQKFSYRMILSKNQLSLYGIQNSGTKEIATKTLHSAAWSFSEFNLVEHLEKENIEYAPLSQIGHFYIGALTGMDEVFVVDSKKIQQEGIEKEIVLPYAYRGGRNCTLRQSNSSGKDNLSLHPDDRWRFIAYG
ncbi:N-6 DNA methylase [Candidatus Bathyarchaeota archaeon]|nr:N-6 DNA methylase [Candidatus Bathyarchaeota archaeon]